MHKRSPAIPVLRATVLSVLIVSSGCLRSETPSVVAYVAVDRQQAEPILRQFEQQTGIRVLALYDAEAAKTTGLVTRLLAESRRPNCDVFWNNEIAQTLLLAERGLLQPYVSPNAGDIPSAWKDAQGRWTGVATRARVIVYNSRLVSSDDAPRSLSALLAPRWRGKIAIANPQFGTTRTHVAALFAAWGPESARAFLQGLLANDVRIVDGNAMVKNLVAQASPHASPILVGLTDTDDVLAGQAAGEPVAMIYPDQNELGTLVVPSTVCLVQGAPRSEAARRLIDYLVSAEVAAQFAGPESGYRPVPRQPLQDSSLRTNALPAPDAIRELPVTYQQIFEQLEASSAWTDQQFTRRN